MSKCPQCTGALVFKNRRNASDGFECAFAGVTPSGHAEGRTAATPPSRSASSTPSRPPAPIESATCSACKKSAPAVEELPEYRAAYRCACGRSWIDFNSELKSFAKKAGVGVMEALRIRREARKTVAREERRAARR